MILSYVRGIRGAYLVEGSSAVEAARCTCHLNPRLHSEAAECSSVKRINFSTQIVLIVRTEILGTRYIFKILI